jgi:hypothetical protein
VPSSVISGASYVAFLSSMRPSKPRRRPAANWALPLRAVGTPGADTRGPRRQPEVPGSEPAAGALTAYGLRLLNLPGAARVLDHGSHDWPELAVEQKIGEGIAGPNLVGHGAARLSLTSGGWMDIARTHDLPFRASVTLNQDRVWDDESVVHPFLSTAVAVVSWWLGRTAFHAGAIATPAGGIAVVGPKGAGKSSMLGWFATQGVPVLADDVVVLEAGRRMLRGPRCVDLRPDAARALGIGEDIGLVGARQRWRHILPEAPAAVPLVAWVLPVWGDAVGLEPIPAGERIGLLYSSLALLGVPPADPGLFLDLARLPAWRLRRRRDWTAIGAAGGMLLDAVGAIDARSTI